MRRLRRRNHARRHGFVLTEVLVTLALTGLLAAFLVPFAAQLIQHWPHGEQRIQTADHWMSMIARLSADLAQTVPISGAAGQSLLFRMRTNSVTLVRPSRDRQESGGLQLTAYAIEPTPSGSALVVYRLPFDRDLVNAEPANLGNATAIFSGPYRLTFVARDGDGTAVDSWIDRKELPRAIELVATPLNTTAPRIRPIVLPIMARIADDGKPHFGTVAQ